MVTVRDLSLALTRYGRNNPSLLRRQDAPKGLSCLLSARIPRTHFAASRVGQATEASRDAFIVPLPTETKRDPQYMRVSKQPTLQQTIRDSAGVVRSLRDIYWCPASRAPAHLRTRLSQSTAGADGVNAQILVEEVSDEEEGSGLVKLAVVTSNGKR